MDKLNRNMYNTLKESLRRVQKGFENHSYGVDYPVVLVDYKEFHAFYFVDDFDAKDYLKKYTEDVSDLPEGEDEELVVYLFCTGREKERWAPLYKKYHFYKRYNNVNYYCRRSNVSFELVTTAEISLGGI